MGQICDKCGKEAALKRWTLTRRSTSFFATDQEVIWQKDLCDSCAKPVIELLESPPS